MRLAPDGTMVTHADLAGVSPFPWNEIAVDGRGNAYVNNIGFDFPGGEVAHRDRRPGRRRTAPTARWRTTSWFPNGMAITPGRLDPDRRRVLRQPAHRLHHRSRRRSVEPPDLGRPGRRASLTASASMPTVRSGTPTSRTAAACASSRAAKCFERFDLDRGCFSAALGGPQGRTLFLVAAEWGDPPEAGRGPSGQVLAVEVDVGAAPVRDHRSDVSPAPRPRAGRSPHVRVGSESIACRPCPTRTS